jgi:hypothetical protein
MQAVQPSVQQPTRGLWPIIAGKLAGTISTENSDYEHLHSALRRLVKRGPRRYGQLHA